jgi:hypothetical protein
MKATESNLSQAVEKGVLTEYEESLIKRIDIQGKGVTQVAGEDGKTKSTVSLQHTTAVKKMGGFVQEEAKLEAGGELAAQVFKLLDAGKTQSYIVTKLRAYPEEVQRLSKLWAKMRERDLNDSGVPGLVASLSSRISKIEAKVEAGGEGDDDALITNLDMKDYVDVLFDVFNGLDERVKKLERDSDDERA